MADVAAVHSGEVIALDVSLFLSPRSESPPSGENLEYDPEFTALELAAQPAEERRIGNDVIDGAEPDWRDVAARAASVMERAHDLRVAGYMAVAQTKMRGLPGFADTLGYVRGCLEQWWDTCHPQLDHDDDDDPTMRINAVANFGDPDRMLRSLRAAPLTESRAFGRFSMRDILVADGEIAPTAGEAAPDLSAISAAFRDTPEQAKMALLDAVRQASDDVRAIDAVFADRTPGQGPDLDQLSRLLYQMRRRIEDLTGLEAGAGDVAPAPSAGDATDPAPAATAPREAGGRRADGPISSREEVIAALEQVISYFKRNEPSSPLVILIERAKGLVGADFVTIIHELAPDGWDSVRKIGGIKEDAYDD